MKAATAETLTHALERAAAFPHAGLRFLDARERETWLGWPEVRERALAVAGGLQALGVGQGERVALVYPTCPEFAAAFFGILLAGAVPAPLYPPIRLGRLAEYHERSARMLRAAGAALILADRRVRRILGETVAGARPRLGCVALDELPAAAARPADPAAGDLALVQFSSGTTVEPKPVALSHRAIMAQVRMLRDYLPDTPEVSHSGVSWLPLYHDMGLVGCVFSALERPAVMTLLPPEAFAARPALWLRAISRTGATISAAPNFAYALAAARIPDADLEGVDLSSWRVALDGAEPIAPRVLAAFSRRFARYGLRPEALTPVYGLAEATLAVTFSDPERPYRVRRFAREALAVEGRAVEDPRGAEKVSVGRPVPGCEIAIRGPLGRDLPEGRVGRIWVRGPSLMDGYLGRPEATARALVEGWLDTGDLGFLSEGELYLVGRAKDVLVVRGRNVAPEEVEHAVDGVAGVRPGCCAAVGVTPEGGEGEIVVLLAEHRHGTSAEEIRGIPEACRQRVLAAAGFAPDRVEVLAPGTLPRTSSGKIQRGEARRRYERRELGAPEPVNRLLLARALLRSRRAFARARRGEKSR